MATYEGLEARMAEVQEELRDHARLIQDTMSKLPEASDLDRSTVFRFLKRDEFDQDSALAKLKETIAWRQEQNIARISSRDLHQDFQRDPALFYHPEMQDQWQRPVVCLQFAKIRRPTGVHDLEPIKKMVLHAWEEGRKLVAKQNQEGDGNVCQMSMVVDLKDAGRANLETELIPYFLGPMRAHYPGLVGAVFVLNYNWTLGGFWRLIKPLLPTTVIDRILFLEDTLAPKLIAADRLPTMYGGTLALPTACKEAPEEALPPLGATGDNEDDSSTSDVFHSAPSSRIPSRRPSFNSEMGQKPSSELPSNLVPSNRAPQCSSGTPRSFLFRIFSCLATIVRGPTVSDQQRRHVTFAELPPSTHRFRTPKASTGPSYLYAALLFLTLRSAWLQRLASRISVILMRALRRTANARLA